MEDIEKLRQELRDSQKKVHVSDEIGKRLLEENGRLTEQLELQEKQFGDDKEGLLQENYVLKRKLDHINRTVIKDHSDEIEYLKLALKRNKDDLDRQHTDQENDVKKFTNRIKSLEMEVEQSRTAINQLKDHTVELTKALTEAHKQIEQISADRCNSSQDEVESLYAQINKLEGEQVMWAQDAAELKSRNQELEMICSHYSDLITKKDSDLEEKDFELCEISNSLKRAREEIFELRGEVDALRLEYQDKKKKGNSLFSEVEDRRIEAEKQLITAQSKYEALKLQYDSTKQQLLQLKMTLAGLLNYSNGKADKVYMQQLQEQLHQARSEIQSLSTKHLQEGIPADEIEETKRPLLESRNDYFKQTQDQLRLKHFLLLAENEKVVKCEQKLHYTEKELEKFKASSLKLAVMVEQLQEKYEPRKIQNRHLKPIVTEEILPLHNTSKLTESQSNEVLREICQSPVRKTSSTKSKLDTCKLTADAQIANLLKEISKENSASDKSKSSGSSCAWLKEPEWEGNRQESTGILERKVKVAFNSETSCSTSSDSFLPTEKSYSHSLGSSKQLQLGSESKNDTSLRKLSMALPEHDRRSSMLDTTADSQVSTKQDKVCCTGSNVTSRKFVKASADETGDCALC